MLRSGIYYELRFDDAEAQTALFADETPLLVVAEHTNADSIVTRLMEYFVATSVVRRLVGERVVLRDSGVPKIEGESHAVFCVDATTAALIARVADRLEPCMRTFIAEGAFPERTDVPAVPFVVLPSGCGSPIRASISGVRHERADSSLRFSDRCDH